jgi:hypothetical protein
MRIVRAGSDVLSTEPIEGEFGRFAVTSGKLRESLAALVAERKNDGLDLYEIDEWI